MLFFYSNFQVYFLFYNKCLCFKLQCLVLAAAPSRQSPEYSPVSHSNAPEASSLSTHKKDVSLSGAPVPNSVSPGIELVFYCSLTLLVDSNSTGF
jgi:hypothetical protein